MLSFGATDPSATIIEVAPRSLCVRVACPVNLFAVDPETTGNAFTVPSRGKSLTNSRTSETGTFSRFTRRLRAMVGEPLPTTPRTATLNGGGRGGHGGP